MDWFETDVEIDAPTAAAIAVGMREVAQADGMIHQRELDLIAAFESELPPGGVPAQSLPAEAHQTYLRSIIMVALADGVISQEEHEAIVRLANELGIEAGLIDEEVLSVKRVFMNVFAGVQVFRDAVVRVAVDLGLPDAEVAALRGEA